MEAFWKELLIVRTHSYYTQTYFRFAKMGLPRNIDQIDMKVQDYDYLEWY